MQVARPAKNCYPLFFRPLIIEINKMFEKTRLIGKATSAKLQLEAAIRLKQALARPTQYILTSSVSGLVQDLVMVGMLAKRSLAIEKTIAMLALSVSHHKSRAITEINPQA